MMLPIEKKILEISYLNYSKISQVLDQLWTIAEPAAKLKNNLAAELLAVLRRWQASINNMPLYSQMPNDPIKENERFLQHANAQRAHKSINNLLMRIERLLQTKPVAKDKK